MRPRGKCAVAELMPFGRGRCAWIGDQVTEAPKGRFRGSHTRNEDVRVEPWDARQGDCI